MNDLRIQVGSAVIYGRPDLFNEFGLFVARDGFEGWDDGVNDAGTDMPRRPGAWGTFKGSINPGARLPSVQGIAKARTPGDLDSLRDQIMGAGVGSWTRIIVSLRGVVRWADGQVLSATFDDTGVRSGRIRGRFSIQLHVPDPRKYGDVHEYTAGQVLFHRGNTDAIPVFTVTGPFPNGYTIAYQGRQFVVTATLAAGAQHVIDMRTGWVKTTSGAVIQGAVSRAETLTVPPGLQTATLTITGAGGSGSLLAKVTDTFI